MEDLILVVWISLLICGVQCNNENVIRSIDGVKEEMLHVEKRMMNHIDSVKMSLEMGLKEQMDQQRQALEEIIKGDSFKDVLRSEVVAQIKQLRRGQNKMNRQFRRVLRSLRELQQERESCKDDKQNVEIGDAMLDTTTLSVPVLRETTTLTPTVTPLPETKVTTLSPDAMRSRIIVAPVFANIPHTFLYINMKTNAINRYPLRGMNNVLALAYASKIRKLLVSSDKPKKIIASPLDTDEVELLLDDVKSHGMAVDEDREMIFLTTASPEHTISSMTTGGDKFTLVVNLTGYGYYPRAIAVDPAQRRIYSCNFLNVFTVQYNGQGLQTLAAGKYINALSLDNTGSILYYNYVNVLVKLSLAETSLTNLNQPTPLANLSQEAWTYQYYANNIYYSSSHDLRNPDGYGMIGAVDVKSELFSRTLHTFNMEDSDYYAICLVP